MSKTSKNVPAIHEAAKAAGLAARTWDRIEKRAAEVHAERAEKPAKSLQIVASGAGLRGLIQVGSVTIELHDNDFAVSTTSE